jgi:hypothetical protein
MTTQLTEGLVRARYDVSCGSEFVPPFWLKSSVYYPKGRDHFADAN